MGEGLDRFISVADGVESAKSVHEGPYLHVYHGRLADVEGSVRVLALAPGVDDEAVRTAFVETVQDWQTASTHPNVATVRARGTEPRPWVAAELVEADSESVADAQSGLSPADCSHLVDDIAEALRVAGLYNARPPALTPETVRVRRTAEGVRAVVADWGLERACRVAAGESLDAPFVPPERLDGGPRTERASVYEFGALAHYLLAGRPPSESDAEAAVTVTSDHDEVDPAVDDALEQALATDPGERHDSAHALRSTLVAALPDPGPRGDSPPGDVGSTVDGGGSTVNDDGPAVDDGDAVSGGLPDLDLAFGGRWSRRRARFAGVALLVVVLAAGVALGPGFPAGGDSGGELAVEVQEGSTLDLDAGGELVFELAGGDGDHAVVLEPGTAAGEQVELSPEAASETPGVEYDDGTWRIDAGAFAELTGAQLDGEETGTYSVTPRAEGFETVPAEISLLSGAADATFEVALDGVEESVAGTPLAVTVTVENTGDQQDEGTVTLEVGDLGTENVVVGLDPGASTTETLAVDTTSGDAGEYTATVTTDDDEVTAPVEVTAATATFAVESVETNDPVEGEELAVTATVENTGDGASVGTVTLDAGDLGAESVDVELDPGESTTETLTIDTTSGDAGEYTATVATDDDETTAPVVVNPAGEAAFAVDIAETNDPVTAGEDLAVTATVENVGDRQGEETVTLDAGDLGTDGVAVDLAPGGSTTETLRVGTAEGDAGGYTATVTAGESEASVAVAVEAVDPDPAEFAVEVTGLGTPVTEGETVSVSAAVENVGDQQGEETVTLDISGLGDDETGVELAPGESTDVTLGVGTAEGDAGEYTAVVASEDDSETISVAVEADDPEPDPAEFTVDIAATNDPVAEGEDLDVTATVQNVGDETGAATVALDAGDLGGDSAAVELGGGASTDVTLTVETGEGDAGGYTATVTAGDDGASTGVTVEADTPGEPFLAVDIAETSDPVEGEDLAVTAVVENTGDGAGAGTVTLDAGELGTDGVEVDLGPGASTEVVLTVGTADGDAGEYTATVATDDDEASTDVTVTEPDPAEFAVEITDTNDPVEGEDLAVTVAVENIGGQQGETTVTLDAGALGEDSVAVDLDDGASTELSLTVETTEGDAGEYAATVATDDDESTETVTVEELAAESSLSGLDIGGQGSSATITEGEDVPVEVTAENVGTASGEFEVDLELGAISESESTGTLAPGETETVTFTGVTDEPPPRVSPPYSLDVSTDDDAVSGALSVEPAGGDTELRSSERLPPVDALEERHCPPVGEVGGELAGGLGVALDREFSCSGHRLLAVG